MLFVIDSGMLGRVWPSAITQQYTSLNFSSLLPRAFALLSASLANAHRLRYHSPKAGLAMLTVLATTISGVHEVGNSHAAVYRAVGNGDGPKIEPRSCTSAARHCAATGANFVRGYLSASRRPPIGRPPNAEFPTDIGCYQPQQRSRLQQHWAALMPKPPRTHTDSHYASFPSRYT